MGVVFFIQVIPAKLRLVAESVNGERLAGKHEIIFDASKLSSGIYFCTLQVERFTKTIKIILCK